VAFSTYVGGEKWEHAHDVCADKDGNVHMVGGTASRDFPTTPGAYDRTFHGGGKQIGGADLSRAAHASGETPRPATENPAELP
jgi:hypothetical protein